MADRLKFAYTRSCNLKETGFIHVDVKDPTDLEEIVTLLKARKFAEFLPVEQAYEDDDFKFTPVFPEVE